MSPGVSFISYSHSEDDIDNTLSVLDDVCKIINKKVSNNDYGKHLEGNMPKIIWTLKIPPTKKIK
ncbi:MAG: hypothetical protein E6L00_07965 [Thaumarchaeota archaeon]|nr:MAG: hypothetical protein E6L00_07965 [Nitrososphaerota archaeon]